MTLYLELRRRIAHASITGASISEADARDIMAHFNLIGRSYADFKEYMAKYYNHPAVGPSGRAALDALDHYAAANGFPTQ